MRVIHLNELRHSDHALRDRCTGELQLEPATSVLCQLYKGHPGSCYWGNGSVRIVWLNEVVVDKRDAFVMKERKRP